MMRKLLVSLLCMMMLVTFMPAMAWATVEDTGADGGAGNVTSDSAGVEGGEEKITIELNPSSGGETDFDNYYIPINTSKSPEENSFYVKCDSKFTWGLEIYDHNDKEGTDGWSRVSEENKGNYVSISAAENGCSEVTVKDKDGKYHGHENLRITFKVGDNQVVVETAMAVEIKYSNRAIEYVKDYGDIEDDILTSGTITDNNPLKEIEKTDNMSTVLYSNFGGVVNGNGDGTEPIIGQEISLQIALKPGYTVEDIKLNGASVEFTTWANSYYALYDASGNRASAVDHPIEGTINKGDKYGNLSEGVKVQPENTAVWVPMEMSNTVDPLDKLKKDLTKYPGYRVEFLASSIQYTIQIKDATIVNSVEIVTNEEAIKATEDVSIIAKDNIEFTKNEKSEVKEKHTEGLKKLYNKNIEIEQVYELEATLNGELVDVIIPVEDAKNKEIVWFMDDDTPVPMDTNVTVDGKGLIMKTGHFSTYAVISKTGGSGNSGSNTGGYIPPAPTDNVTNNNTAGDKNTTADIKPSTPTTEGKVEATVDTETADKIVDKAVENGSTEVVIDATSSSAVSAEKVDAAKITLPTEAMQGIAEKTEAAVTIKTDAGKVTMDKEAVASVATEAAAQGSETVMLVMEKVKEEAKAVHFDLKLVTTDGEITDFKGGKVSVTVKLPEEMKPHKLVCLYIDNKGKVSKVNGKKNDDGTYTFYTNHFSTYAIMTEEDADQMIKEQQIAAVKAFKITTKTELVKGKKMIIKWTVKGDESAIDGYRVYYSTKKVDKGFKVLADVKGKKLNHTSIRTNKNIKKGTRVYYRVKAFKMMDGLRYLSEYSTAGQRTWK